MVIEENVTPGFVRVKIVIKKRPEGEAKGWPGQSFTLCKLAESTPENPQTSDTYAYKFVGGNWNSSNGGSAGGFQFPADKEPKNIEIEIEDSEYSEDASLYSIESITVFYDSRNMPANLVPDWSGSSGTIVNSCEDAESGYYQVVFSVNDDKGAGSLICDPRWQNW